MGSVRIRKAWLALLAALFLALWFGTLDEREFFNPDEGRYAEIPREMLASGDWITPRLNGLKYFEKPALQYWITASSFALLGKEEFVARLWPALAGFCTLLIVYFAGRRIAGVRTGVVAALALASTFQFFIFSQILTLDMSLTLFLNLALSALLNAQDLRSTEKLRRNWAIIMWAAMGLAVLSKGLVGVVLPALVLSVYCIIERDWRPLKNLQWRAGLITWCVVTLPWFVIVQMRNPEFFQFFVIGEHFARYQLNEHHRFGAWHYFIVVLFVGGLPWLPAYIRAVYVSWRGPRNPNFAVQPARLLTCWAVVIFLFYSFSASKLPGYILPIYPALALLFGIDVQRRNIKTNRPVLFFAAIVGLALVAAAPAVTSIRKFAEVKAMLLAYIPWIQAGGMILIGTALAAFFARRRPRVTLAVLTFGSLLSFQALLTGTESIEDAFSSETLVGNVLDKIGEFDANAPFFSVGMYDQSLPHHLSRTVILVDYSGELAMGIRVEPGRAISDLEKFRTRWRNSTQAYAIMSKDRFDQEKLVGLPMALLAANANAVIVARVAPTSETKLPRRLDD